jgi:two-component system nitrate/nitrite response regulator NarL
VSTIRVLVAEDHPLYRKGLVESIEAREGLELVGEAIDGRQALDAVRTLRPEVVVLDLRLPELDGIEVLRLIEAEELGARVLLLSAHLDGDLVYDAFESGAAGYLSKEALGDEVCDAVLAVASGERALSPQLQHRLVEEIARRKEEKTELSFREREILELMAEGLSNAQIAERLSVSESTVKSYAGRMYEKLSVSSRGAAIAEAMRRGILS